MTPLWVQVAYLVAAICFILALKGLSGPRTARNGNLVGAAGAALAVGVTFFAEEIDNLGWILASLAVGAVLGAVAARRVAMTAMPQLVALFNGVGGAAAALVGLLEFVAAGETESTTAVAATVFSVLIGGVSASGSAITFAKLQELMTGRPVVIPGARILTPLLAVVSVGLAVAVVVTESVPLLLALGVAALLLGVLFVLPVGGADVPVVISLLNAFTGLSVAATGYALGNVLLLIAGTLVGASGTLLTRLMAEAMGRPLTATLFGALSGGSTLGSTAAVSDRPVRSVTAQDVAIMLGYADRVVIVPGYGLAVAQGQHVLRELVGTLEGRGVTVDYGIHPVAGRMPGHMNVLLAEADVPYEALKEMDEVNREIASVDVALVVGANDVVNPAARSDAASPIYGMPIIDAGLARQVVFLKRSMRPGFAGIDNELLYQPNTALLFGDAKDSLSKVVAALDAV
jgi:NAD(P) transhydrogenase subunit beta